MNINNTRTKLPKHLVLGIKFPQLIGIIILVGSILALTLNISPSQAASGLNIQLAIVPNTTTVDVGQTVTYHIQFSCNGVNGACGAFTLTDVLDANLTNIQITSIPTQTPSFTSSIVGQTVTIQTSNLLDGSIYEAVIQAQVKLAATSGTTIPNFATGTIASPSESDNTNTVTVTVNAPQPNGLWQLTKTQTSPAPPTKPTTDNPVSYNLCLEPTAQVNNEPLTGVSLMDTFPAGAIVLSPVAGPGITITGTTITWAAPNLTDAEVATAFGNDTTGPSCVLRTVTLQFNDGAGTPPGTFNYPSNPGSNSASATSNEIPNIGPANVPIDLVAPNPVPAVQKSIGGNPISLTSGLGRFFLHSDTTTANVPINTLTLVDNLPAGNPLTVTSISSGTWVTSLSAPQVDPVATIEYSTNGGVSWVTLGTANGTANTTYNGLPAGITNVHWVFAAGVPLGFTTGETTGGVPLAYQGGTEPEIDFIPNQAVAVSGGVYANCLIPIYNGTSGASSCANADIETNNVNILSSKSVAGGPFAPEDQVPFTLTMKLTERSNPGSPLLNPQIVDVLPSSLTFAPVNPPNPLPPPNITYDLSSCSGSLGTPTFTDSNPGNPGSTLTWAWPGSISQLSTGGDCVITIHFWAQVNPGTAATTPNPPYSGIPYSNSATFTTSSPNLECENGTAVQAGCQQDAPFDVKDVTVLNSQKWIVNPNITVPPDETSDGYFYNSVTNTDNDPSCPTYGPGDGIAPDVQYTRLPCVVKGYPVNKNTGTAPLYNHDSNFNYKLIVTNTGNVPGWNYYLYDILPHVGDDGSGGPQQSVARNSQFNPYMTGPIVLGILPPQLNAGNVIVEYNLTYNPDRPEVGVTTGNNTWYTAGTLPGGDWSAVRSFRIRFTPGVGLPPAPALNVGDEMLFTVPMQIPANAQGGQIAWNSFAQTITDVNGQLPTAEPRKVGIMVPQRMSIGNRVWIDNGAGGGTANNGIQDGGELGVANVAVTLYQNNGGVPGAVVATTTTDANGYYLFDFDNLNHHPLDAGSYIVGIDASNWNVTGPLANYISSVGNTANNDKHDNGVDNTNLATNGILSSVINLTLNNAPTGESDLSGNPKDGANSLGNYGETDHNSNLTVDFGFWLPMSIGNRVWLDEGAGGGVRNDGIRQPGEPGIDGVHVTLYKNNGGVPGAVVATTTTANGGYYLFDGLIEGTYIVGIDHSNFVTGGPLVTMASSYPFPASAFASPSVLADDDHDHGVDNTGFATAPDGVVSQPVTLQLNSEPIGEVDRDSLAANGDNGTHSELDVNSDLTIDFGFYVPKMSIGNRVWNDNGGGNPQLGNDALLDNSEPGIAGVTLNLYQATPGTCGTPGGTPNGVPGTLVGTTTTDGNGYYLFDNLSAGQYVVTIPNANFGSGQPLFELASSTGLNGADTNNSHDNGCDNLDATYGTISRMVTLAIEQQPVAPVDQGNTGDLSGNTGRDGPQSIGNQGQFDFDSNLTLDFGFYRPMSIGNRVWLDDGQGAGGDSNDGIQNGTEPGISGVTVKLYEAPSGATAATPFNPADTLLTTTTTDGNGYYLFSGLAEGNYYVWIDSANFGTGQPLVGYLNSSGVAATTGSDKNDHGVDDSNPAANGTASQLIALTANTQPTGETDLSNNAADGAPGYRGTHGETDADSNLDIDFGFYTPMSLGNRVWLDNGQGAGGVSNNGIQDGTEAGIKSVAVSLYRDDNGDGTPDGAAIATAPTDANGYYLFPNIGPGKYVVGIDKANWDSGGPLQNYLSSVGNTANTDKHDNGIDVPTPATTGVLSNTITMTPGSEPTGESDLGPDGTGGPADNNSNLTVDFGFWLPMSLGNRVWLDEGNGNPALRNDGLIDNGESGIDGVHVTLYLNNGGVPGTVVAKTTTASGGYYLFDGLTEGSYIVGIDHCNFVAVACAAPDNYTPVLTNMAGSYPFPAGTFTTPSLLTDDNKDHGIDNIGFASAANGVISQPITLTANSEPTGESDLGPQGYGSHTETDNNSDLTIDFGFYVPKMSIGNRVWNDNGGGNPLLGNDAILDNGELGISGVTLNLYQATAGTCGAPGGTPNGIPGTFVATTTTDSNGYYLFDNLSAGQYVVTVPNANFASGQPLFELTSSTGLNGADTNNSHDNGCDNLDATYGTVSRMVTLAIQQQPVAPVDQGSAGDLSGNTGRDGPQSIGNQGQLDFDSNLTLDLGFYRPMSIGNRVWLDNGQGGGTANNGLQDGTEPGISGVTVKLYEAPSGATAATPFNPADTLLKTTTTDANGYYLFDGLLEGNYYVWIDKSNFGSGQPLVNYDNPYGAAATSGTGLDQHDHGVDDNYPALNGIASHLVVLTADTQPTDESDLSPDTTTYGPNSRGTHTESNADSNLDIDFGFYTPTFSVGNRVWFDTNDDGILNAADNANPENPGNQGLKQVTVNLYNSTPGSCTLGAFIKSTTTDTNGYYLFDNLSAGTYMVEIDQLNFRTGGPLQNMYSSNGVTTFVSPPVNDVDSHDRGVDNANTQVGGVHSCDFTLSKDAEPLAETVSGNPADGPAGWGNQGQIDSNSDLIVDFGFYMPMSIGNRVWFDKNSDGILNGTETGIAGVSVGLYSDNAGNPGTLIKSTTTDSNGYYLFDNLTPGTYDVVVAASNFAAGQPLKGMSSSPSVGAAGTDSTDKGKDAPVAQGITSPPVTLTLGAEPLSEGDLSNNAADGPSYIGHDGEIDSDSNMTLDFGFTSGQLSLGNRVWIDSNNNGTLDAGEVSVANIKVSLYTDNNVAGTPDGPAVATTTTVAGGYYLFANLAPGNYVVGIDNSNFNTGQPLHSMISSTGNFTPLYTADSHDNGFDTPNATYGILSSPIPMSSGSEPTGELDTGTLGTGGAADNDSNLMVDLGFYTPMSIGNRVWYDTNGDGIQNGIEAGIPAVTIGLYADANKDGTPDSGTPLATTTTDANGYYLFPGLGTGSYVVRIEASNFQAGGALLNVKSSTGSTINTDQHDNGIDNATPETNGILSHTVTLTVNGEPVGESDLGPKANGPNGETDVNANLTVDFGFSGGGLSLGNRIWIDDGAGGGTALDGIRQPSELAVGNVTVGLFVDANGDGVPDASTPLVVTTTDANGYYLFDALSAGKYIVEVLPANFATGKPLFGYGSTKTGAVNSDNDDNGIDNNNPALNGILSSTITMQPGAEPTGETDLGTKGIGTAKNDDDSNLTVDFGFYKFMSIGNRVWFDTDDNGILDTGENGIAGVKITLFQDDGTGVFNPADTVVATTTTDSKGYYLFDNLVPGKYFAQVDASNFGSGGVLSGFSSSTGVKGNNVDNTDNGNDDAAPQTDGIQTALITLTYGAEPVGEVDQSGDALRDGPYFRGNQGQSDNNSNLTIDFGFTAPVMSLGNRVWLDNGAGAGGIASNGIQDGTEPGISGVTVGLYADVNKDGQPDGEAITSAITDTNGYYLFDKVAPGSYVVRIEPTNFASGASLFGLTNSLGATTNTDQHDNGIDNGSPATTGILSATINMVSGGAPTGESDLGPLGTGSADDPNSNLTVDFGFNVSYDFGDAPDAPTNPGYNYGTLLANNGARHQIISTLYLGSLVDAEPDGQPNLTATGDDGNGTPSDEDGVKIPVFVAGTTQNVEVTVFNNTGNPATLALWVDLAGSKTFVGSATNSITVPSSLTPQIVQVPIVVPIGADVATGGTTYLRARLSTDAAAVSTPLGLAPDGEIEDYKVTVNPPGVAITKTNNQNSITVGQTTTYTITINNSGVPVINDNIVDNPPVGSPNGFVPASLTWTCVASNGASCLTGKPAGTGATGTGPINQFIDIPNSGTVVYTLAAMLNTGYNQPTVTNQVTLSTGQSAQDVDSIIFDPASGVKTGEVQGGNMIRWTMTWINLGLPQAATVTDPIPAGQTFAGNLVCTPTGTTTSTTCVFNNNIVTWSGTLGTGPANSVQIAFNVQVSGPNTYRNTGTLSIGGKMSNAPGQVTLGGGGGGNNASGQLGAEPIKPVTITKTADVSVAFPGDKINWTITITNPNSVTVSNTQVSDTIPDGLTLLSVSSSVPTTTKGSTVSAIIPYMDAGQSITITLHTQVKRDTKLTEIDNIGDLIGVGQAEASVQIAHELPPTGEHPDDPPSTLWLPELLGLGMVGIALSLRIRQARHHRAK